MSAFEVITEEEFTKSTASGGAPPPTLEREGVAVSVMPATSDAVELTYCEFCKGYYIMEYHVTRGGET